MPQDPFQTLQVDRRASEQQIRRAYYRLVRRYHPDRNQNDPDAIERFKQVQLAYEEIAHRVGPARPSAVIRATTCGVGSTINPTPPNRRPASRNPPTPAGGDDRRRLRWLFAIGLLLAGTTAGNRLWLQADRWIAAFDHRQASPSASSTPPATTTDRDGSSARRAPLVPIPSSRPNRADASRGNQPAIVVPVASPSEAGTVVSAQGETTAPQVSLLPETRRWPASASLINWNTLQLAGQQLGVALETVRDQVGTIEFDTDPPATDRAPRSSRKAEAPLGLSTYRLVDPTSGESTQASPGLPELATIERANRPPYQSLALERLPSAATQSPRPIPALEPTPMPTQTAQTLPPISYTSKLDAAQTNPLPSPTVAESPAPPALKALPK